MSNSPGKTLATIFEADGTEHQQEIEWSIESLRALMGGDYRIVAQYKGAHVLEHDSWHSLGMEHNMPASVRVGRALHGKIVIAKEPPR